MLKTGKVNGGTAMAAISMMLILVLGALGAASQSIPSVVVSSTATVNPSGTLSVGKVVQDTCGNLYELETGGSLMEIPAGGNAAQSISLPPNGLASTGSYGIAIDNSNNLYLAGMDGYYSGGHLWKIPSSNCVPLVASATDLYSDLGSLGAISYYSAPNGVTADGSGNIFLSTYYSCCTTTNYWIVEITPANTAVAVLSNYASLITSMAVDTSDDVFFTASGSGDVYEIPASSYSSTTAGTPTAVISSGLQTPLGLAFDSSGNLYVGDSGTGNIYEVPYTTAGTSTKAALQFGSIYLLAAGAPIGAPLTISHDNKSFFFGDSNASINQVALGSANVGAVAVGSSGIAIIGLAFNAAVTPTAFTLYPPGGQFSINGGSSPCSTGTAYTAGQHCNETVKFIPATPGTALAGVGVSGSGGAQLASIYVSGTGEGPGLTLDPGTPVATGSGFKTPEGVAIDAAGDVFYADAGNNAVYEYKSGSSTAVSIGTGLTKPAGVAVDGAGNVFIVDTGNNRIIEVPIVNGSLSSAAQATLATSLAGTTLSAPAGIAVDATGDLFIADTGNNRIIGVPNTGTLNLSAAVAIGSSLSGPLAVVANASGNLYVADSGAGQIYEIFSPLGVPSQQLIAVGFGNPTGLAVDASGSLFVADYANGEVVRIPNVSGSLEPNEQVEAGIGVSTPYGVALDASGNLYVTSGSGASADLITRTSTTFGFGDWAVNATSGLLAAQIEDEGNQPLILGTPYFTAAGNTGDFSISTTGSGICGAGATLAAGTSCELDATFTPQASGARTDTLTLSSNATNAATTQVKLTGNGTATASTTIKLAVTSPASGSPSYGQAITLSATVTASSGTPTGTVTLIVDGVQFGDATLNSSGVATFNLASGLTGGSHTLIAVYNGTASFNGSVSSALQLNVGKTATATGLAVTPPYTNPLSALPGNTITLTAAIGFPGVGIPTGTVSFAANGTTLGSAPVQPAAGGIFAATFTTSSLAVGNYTVVATYSGDSNYIGSVSPASATIYIVTSPYVTVTSSGASLTSSSSSNSNVTFTMTSYGGWNGLVGFSCLASSLPANARCVFSPGQIEVLPGTPSAAAANPPVNLSIVIDQPPQTPTASKLLWWLAGPTGLLLLFARRRFARHARGLIAAALAFILLSIAAGGMGACAGGVQYTTPSGASTVTVYGWSDPYTTMPTSSNANPSTQACGINPTTKVADPAFAPCSQTAFQVSLTVQ